jgi:murein DD-endopeptidase MepM/ murein hydrolase activator NlpD
MRGIRTVESTASQDLQVRLERPRVSVVSTHHYINLGGTEMVVYRATPEDVESGVVVGDIEYPGYPAAGATVEGVKLDDPALRIAFFALLYDQDVNTPMRVYARDPAGNTARADFDHRTFPKPFKKSQIPLDDKFLDRVVPAILEGTTEIKPDGDNLAKFLVINGELRRKNAEKIASCAKQTSKEMLWRGIVFHPFTNNAVESAFADARTYIYKGKEVDRQVHLGFDLASYAGTPIVAANRGKVLYADELGIYGNCVILDHGMGVQSLYAHLSSIEVKVGQDVEKEQQLGRSGMTGLAGGDHLHFTMLLNGRAINPVEWWDQHWIQDRILRKLGVTAGTK